MKIIKAISKGALAWMIVIGGLNIFLSFLLHNPFQCLAVVPWLFIKCSDRKFGNGKKYFIYRQLFILSISIATIIVGNI